MNPLLLVLIVVAFVIGIPLGKKLFAKKEQIINQLADERKAALDLAVVLRANGLKLLPQVLEDFAVGDVTDLFAQLKNLAVIAKSGNDAIEKDLEQVYERVLDAKLKQPEGLALVRAKVAAAGIK
jgi:uncharacterized protein YneF (UPF0154 family)